MEDTIIIGIVAMAVFAGILSVVKKARSKSSCCSSGSDYKPRKKKLKTVIGKKTFYVTGMHCEKCSNRVMEVVNDIPHVAGVVDLKKGLLTVSYEQEVSDDVILREIRRVGYDAEAI